MENQEVNKMEQGKDNGEKEMEMLLNNANEMKGASLKEEKKISDAEKKMIKRTEEQLERVANQDPSGLYNFLESSTSIVQGMAFHAISKIIINKAVDDVPDEYYFLAKAATTLALNQAVAAITGVAAGPVSILSIKLDVVKKKLEEMSKKVDKIIEEPMKTAGNHFLRAIFHIEAGEYEGSIRELQEALNNTLKAINYIDGDKKYLQGMVTCTKYLAMGDQLMEKYDKENNVFLPYDILPIKKKIKLRTITKGHLDRLIQTNNQHKKKAHIFKTAAGKKMMEVAHHDVVDDFVRQQFPLLVPPGSMIPPKYLPAGHEDAVIYNIHKKTTWSQKQLGSLLLMWKNEEVTHFRVIDGNQLFEIPITEDEEIDISVSSSGMLLFSASDSSEIIPTTLSLEEEYPNIVEDWQTKEREDCLKLYNAFSNINRQTSVEKKNEVLWEAAKNGDIDKVTYTINIGAEINSKEPATIMDQDVGKGKLSKLKSKAFAFVEKEVSKRKGAVTKEEETIKDDKSGLHNTAEAGHTECLYRLLELGANPNIEDKDSSTPLHLAARNGHLQVVQILCEAGVNMKAKNAKGLTAWDVAEDVEMKEYLKLHC